MPLSPEDQKRLDEYSKKYDENLAKIREVLGPDYTPSHPKEYYVNPERLAIHDKLNAQQEKNDAIVKQMANMKAATPFARANRGLYDVSGTPEAQQKNERIQYIISSRSPAMLKEKEKLLVGIMNDIRTLDPSKLSSSVPFDERINYISDNWSALYQGMVGQNYTLGTSYLNEMGLTVTPEMEEKVKALKKYGDDIGGAARGLIDFVRTDTFMTFPYEDLTETQIAMLLSSKDKELMMVMPGLLNLGLSDAAKKITEVPPIEEPFVLDDAHPIFEEQTRLFGDVAVDPDELSSIREGFERLSEELKASSDTVPEYEALVQAMDIANAALRKADDGTPETLQENSAELYEAVNGAYKAANAYGKLFDKGPENEFQIKQRDLAVAIRLLAHEAGGSAENLAAFQETVNVLNSPEKKAFQAVKDAQKDAVRTMQEKAKAGSEAQFAAEKKAAQDRAISGLQQPDEAADRADTLINVAATAGFTQEQDIADKAADFATVEFSTRNLNLAADPKQAAKMIQGLAKWSVRNTVEMGKEAARLQTEKGLTEEQAIYAASAYSAAGLKRKAAMGEIYGNLNNATPSSFLPEVAKELGLSGTYESYTELLNAVAAPMQQKYESALYGEELNALRLGKAAGSNTLKSPGFRRDQADTLEEYSLNQTQDLLDRVPASLEGQNFQVFRDRMLQNSSQIENALDAMDNARGALLHHNTEQYNNFHEALEEYAGMASGIDPESVSMNDLDDLDALGRMGKAADKVVETAAIYLSDKWKDRGTTLGQVRFDQAMSILQTMAPEKALQVQQDLNKERAAHGLEPMKFQDPPQKPVNAVSIDKDGLRSANLFDLAEEVTLPDLPKKVEEKKEAALEKAPEPATKEKIQQEVQNSRDILTSAEGQKLDDRSLKTHLATLMLGDHFTSNPKQLENLKNMKNFSAVVDQAAKSEAFQQITKDYTPETLPAHEKELKTPLASRILMMKYSKAQIDINKQNDYQKQRSREVDAVMQERNNRMAPKGPQGGPGIG